MTQKYDPNRYDLALEIRDQAEADVYFAALVARRMTQSHVSEDEAEVMEKETLGYYAGYYGDETRERVERLYRCVHPFFGSIALNGPPSPEAAFRMGMAFAQKRQDEEAKNRLPTIWERLRERD